MTDTDLLNRFHIGCSKTESILFNLNDRRFTKYIVNVDIQNISQKYNYCIKVQWRQYKQAKYTFLY